MNPQGRNIKIFAANSNMELAKEITRYVGVPMGRSVVSKFSDGEITVSIQETVRESDVFVIQSTCAPVNTNLMELLIMIDAFKRLLPGRLLQLFLIMVMPGRTAR